MKNILLRAPLLTKSGYGEHARQIAKWLFRKAALENNIEITTELLRWGNTHWITDTEFDDGLIGEVISSSTNKKPFYDVTIQLQLPNEWNPMIGKFNIGITAGVETDICNPEWINYINAMDLVIVPSEFTKNTFLKTGDVKTKIVVIPESFPEEFLSEQNEEISLNLETKFNFLIFGQLTGNGVYNDRKNLPVTVKLLKETFEGNPDVGIIVKTNLGSQTQIDKNNVSNVLTRLAKEINLNSSGPKVYLLHGDMTNIELKALYTDPKIKALVSLTHGEGFGLTLLEAAACGLPVIATDWSAHTEFLSKGKYISVPTKVEQIHPSRIDNQIFMQNAKWANVIENEAKQRFRKFYESPQKPLEWASQLQKIIKKDYSIQKIMEIYSENLNEYLK